MAKVSITASSKHGSLEIASGRHRLQVESRPWLQIIRRGSGKSEEVLLDLSCWIVYYH